MYFMLALDGVFIYERCSMFHISTYASKSSYSENYAMRVYPKRME